MSGGLDSTYAAKKLLDEGHEVEGAVLVMHEYTDVVAARQSADRLGIPLHIVDCQNRFLEKVKRPFAEDYACGRTPNPCIICNPEVKFYALAEYARSHGFDRIATGHYAALTEYDSGEGKCLALVRPRDKARDQTYMLYRLSPDILSMLVLPMADVVKSDLRASIKGTALEELDSPDSQEICFLPNGGYAEYVESLMGTSPAGNFIDHRGNRLGEHKGIIHYTIGQRKGLGISLGERAFVVDINPRDNTVTLDTAPALSTTIHINNVVYTAIARERGVFVRRYDVKVRYLATPIGADVTFYPDGTATVHPDTPQRSVTPGQSCVFYDGDVVVGGGIITGTELEPRSL